MIAEISSLITSSRAAYDIAKGLTSVYVDDKVRERTSELLNILLAVQTNAIAVQTNHHALLKEKDDLDKKMMEFKNWSKTERQYELKEIASGTFVYGYKKPAESAKPDHWLCPKCFQEKNAHILQLHYDGDAGPKEYICPNCKTSIKIRTKSHNSFPRRGRTNRSNFM